MGDVFEVTGPCGVARKIPEEVYVEGTCQIAGWVITSPLWHPLWSQYFLGAVSLRDVPGQPPAVKQFPEATHEIMVLTLNPDHGPFDADRIGPEHKLRFLMPGNVVHQVISTDEQVEEITALLANAVVHGMLCPETAGAGFTVREAWASSIEQTLDHYRDPHHGRLN